MSGRSRSLIGLLVALALAFAGSTSAAADERDPRVVGGFEISIEQAPYTVALAEAGGGNAFNRQFCGGSLVAPTLVVTAAHCVYDFGLLGSLLNCGAVLDDDGFNNPASDFSVIAGRTTLSSSEGDEIGVAEIYYFEGSSSAPDTQAQSSDPDTGAGHLFDCDTLEWDAVLLELEDAASAPAAPILIAGAGEEATWAAGKPALIAGWGTTSEGGSRSDHLRAGQVEMIADSTCASVYPGPNSSLEFFPETMVCAGIFPEGGVDTCQGDSGGPLVVPIAGGGGRLVGDTSFGEGCAREELPGIYGRIADDPMRSALEAAALEVAGVDITGSGAQADNRPPETTITKHPRKRGKKRKARFRFIADEPATFECRVDKRRFKACTSPYRKRVSRKNHRFRVRAIDLSGNVDPSADLFKWKVKKKRK
jgi:trypsin